VKISPKSGLILGPRRRGADGLRRRARGVLRERRRLRQSLSPLRCPAPTVAMYRPPPLTISAMRSHAGGGWRTSSGVYQTPRGATSL